MTLRTPIAFLVVLAAAVVASLYLSPLWSNAVLTGRTFVSTTQWWSSAHVLDLLDECMLLLAAGALLVILARLARPFWWGVGLGAAFCAIRLSLGSNWFGDEANAFTYAWAYSSSIVPVVFGGLGAVAASRLLRRRVVGAA